ncbi:MAG: UDP-N-acetylmuramoyl-tripeptide--D-alanyl-D-alanine ligase, partial [Halanaerobiales bacterium]
MKPLKLKEITGAVNGNLLTGNPDKLINDISTDTRTMKEGDLFIALIGDNFDGHDFVKKAIEKGASGVIIDRKIKISKDIAQILVDNTTRALQDLSRYYRNLFNDIKIIGITGSAGKTTTKDMVAEVLKQKFKILKTEENLNNYIGVPLTLLSLNGDEDFAVIEMGMNQKGEISLLSRIANPEIGIITNVGPAHLKNFETVSDIAREKKQLISNLSPRGTVLLNYDNKYTKKMKKEIKGKKLIFFGLSDKADIYADNIANYSEDLSISFRVKYNRENYNLKLNKPGIHNIYNVLPAIAIARDEGISWEQIEKALDSVELSSLRLEIKEKKVRSVITKSNLP